MRPMLEDATASAWTCREGKQHRERKGREGERGVRRFRDRAKHAPDQ